MMAKALVMRANALVCAIYVLANGIVPLLPWYGDEEETVGYNDGDSDSDDDTQRHSFVPVCSHIKMG